MVVVVVVCKWFLDSTLPEILQMVSMFLYFSWRRRVLGQPLNFVCIFLSNAKSRWTLSTVHPLCLLSHSVSFFRSRLRVTFVKYLLRPGVDTISSLSRRQFTCHRLYYWHPVSTLVKLSPLTNILSTHLQYTLISYLRLTLPFFTITIKKRGIVQGGGEKNDT